MITVLAGGVGAARLLAGLQSVYPPHRIHAIVNVGDDCELHGLHISPDIDTVSYTLAGAIDPRRGWGLADESWKAMDQLRRLGGDAWFNLGDRDLGTHLYRTSRLADGATLTEVTDEIAGALGVEVHVLPVSDDQVRTRVTIREQSDGGETSTREVPFQEYFVRLGHRVPLTSVRFAGSAIARPGPEVLDVIARAHRVVIAPSNPIVSIDPVLSIPGVRDAVVARRDDTIAVSPIVAGAALKGPADRMLGELGHESSVVGVARIYAPIARALVIDEADAHLADAVADCGLEPIVAPTVMSDVNRAGNLGQVVIR